MHSLDKSCYITQLSLSRTQHLVNCAALDATSFGGIEDVAIHPLDGMVYFAVKNESNGSFTDVEINPKDSLVYFAVKRESNEDLGLERKGVVSRFNDSANGID